MERVEKIKEIITEFYLKNISEKGEYRGDSQLLTCKLKEEVSDITPEETLRYFSEVMIEQKDPIYMMFSNKIK